MADGLAGASGEDCHAHQPCGEREGNFRWIYLGMYTFGKINGNKTFGLKPATASDSIKQFEKHFTKI